MTRTHALGPQQRTFTVSVLLVGALYAFACVALLSWPAQAAAAPAAPAASTPAISWTKCNVRMGPFQCATVRVPLDYDRPGGERIDLALVRLPATDPARRIGSLLLNPGGPGGSGVELVVGIGQELFTPEVRARFDLVGFDPRGVMASAGLRCFGTPKQMGRERPFAFPTTPAQEAVQAALDAKLDQACQARGTRIRDHMSTANVARDMDVIRRAVGDDKLNFAGYSYGSYLGTTYANMFPARVRAIVVDGVVDPIAWSTGRGDEALTVPFSTRVGSHSGAQATLEEFFRLCDAAGPDCALSGGAAARFAALAERAREAPLRFVFSDGFTVEMDYSELIGITFGALYSSTVWGELAQGLADAEAASMSRAAGANSGARLRGLVAKYGASLYPNFLEGNTGVACSDSDSPDSYAAWSAAGAAADESSLFGRLWTWVWSPCAQWRGFDADRYMGPFTRATANPVLVVGTTFDAATRYEGALTVHDLMPNSALLTVNGWGHTSGFMSRCADDHIASYLLELRTPADGTTCDQDVPPFSASGPDTPAARHRVQALSYMNGRSSRATLSAQRWGARDRAARSRMGGPLRRGSADDSTESLRAQVGTDGDGDAVYAWTSLQTATGIAQVQARTRSAGGRLGPRIALSDPAAEALDVHVAVNERGAALFSWAQFDPDGGGLALKLRSRSPGGSLGPIVAVSDPSGADVFDHNIAITPTGDAVVAWTSVDFASGDVRAWARSRSAHSGLGDIVALGDPSLEAFRPQVALDADANATFVWTQGDRATGKTRVHTRSRAAGGALGPIRDLDADTRNADEPKVAVDADGDTVFAWLSFDANARAAVRSRSLPRGGTLGPVADLSAADDDAWDPDLAIGADGDATFTWWIAGDGGARVESTSRSARGRFAARAILSAGADDGFEPQVAVDDDGDAVITWLAFNRAGVRVQARARSARGALGPSTDLTVATEDAFSAQVAMSGDGDAAFGWSALDAAHYQVQGRARSSSGKLGRLGVVSSSDRHAIDTQRHTIAERLRAITTAIDGDRG